MGYIMWGQMWTAIGVVATVLIFVIGSVYGLGKIVGQFNQLVGQFQRLVGSVDKLVEKVDTLVSHVAGLEARVGNLERRKHPRDPA